MIKTIDTIILILLLLMTIKGIWRGLKKELISLISYGVALLTALSQIDNGTRFFEKTFDFHPILGYFASYFVVFILVLFVTKFFLKNILKIIQREQSSGLLDSIGGMVFGFCLGMLIVGMFVNMIKPIPVMNSIFEQSHRSRFLPLTEKYVQPIVANFMPNPMDNMPLDELLSKGAGENLILPGMMEELLGDDLGALSGSGGLDIPDIGSIQKQFQDAIGPSITEQPTSQATQQQPGQKVQSVVNPGVPDGVDPGALQRAMGILNAGADTSGGGKTIDELLNIIKQ